MGSRSIRDSKEIEAAFWIPTTRPLGSRRSIRDSKEIEAEEMCRGFEAARSRSIRDSKEIEAVEKVTETVARKMPQHP